MIRNGVGPVSSLFFNTVIFVRLTNSSCRWSLYASWVTDAVNENRVIQKSVCVFHITEIINCAWMFFTYFRKNATNAGIIMWMACIGNAVRCVGVSRLGSLLLPF